MDRPESDGSATSQGIAPSSRDSCPAGKEPRISFDSLKALKLKHDAPLLKEHRNPSPFGSKSYEKNVKKWDGKRVDDYEKHRQVCELAWLNQIPQDIQFENIGMHGTNFDVVLRAMAMGGQLLPVGNILKRGGRLVTGEYGVTDLNLRRVSVACLQGGVLITSAFRDTRRYAMNATRPHLKIDNGRASHVPIIVIGDGMDTIKNEGRTNNYVLSAGVSVKSTACIWEVAFKRVNIRGVLCPANDEAYVRDTLEKAGFKLEVNTFESFERHLKQNTELGCESSAEGTAQRQATLEKLTGREFPDYPAFSFKEC